MSRLFLIAALSASAFTFPGTALAQDPCAALSPGGRRTCYAVGIYNTRQQALTASSELVESIQRDLNAGRYVSACSGAQSLERLAIAYLPEMRIHAINTEREVCKLANR